ncbi:UDP-GlcNAcbeta GAL beta1,3 N-acetyl glucosaminyl transferase 3 [Elephant endotheliotropic herpesvirus 3A]|uniref:UDP-GlcNAcbeta GAL beta1,3 N-acetyl glucosaminyl transferase 3 n=1 Tax=Elephant endotheliotropic herpesvirus 3A TaxID=1329409 RepID=A0A866VSJ5_9BETA|nr:UDP-GlcNAcbeta GAL beta1,3 N-acetyl glucosaminyl transferase 3 [Elephant endotheliotropic herpesvirus 3A]QOE74372.1 UDP-GlcNAcbeta GAL beta1,3 N-acetyl glucosaminyl transferase 3 [Elephant endotheliotropic herpesvirus 3A]
MKGRYNFPIRLICLCILACFSILLLYTWFLSSGKREDSIWRYRHDPGGFSFYEENIIQYARKHIGNNKNDIIQNQVLINENTIYINKNFLLHKTYPTCHANYSALPDVNLVKYQIRVKNFMLYKHCRQFTLLQDVPENKCPIGGVFLLMIIKSAPTNYEKREVIRKTWGEEIYGSKYNIRRIFIVGTSSDPTEAEKVNWMLAAEAKMYRDILQWDFHDTFFNLTLKQLLFMEWRSYSVRCAHAKFIFNGDDDVYVNIKNIISYLKNNDSDSHLFVGHLIEGASPIRIPWSKYFVPNVITNVSKYPPYCGGGGLLISRHTMNLIADAAEHVDIFPIDDVFIGMCLEKQGLTPSHHRGIRMLDFSKHKVAKFNPCLYTELLVVHSVRPYEQLLVYNVLNNHTMFCSDEKCKC